MATSLQPQRGDDKVAIPFTFDTRWESVELKMSKLYLSGLGGIACIILWVVFMFIASDNSVRFWATVILLVGIPTILRYLVIGEKKFRTSYRELIERNYSYDYSLFWNIYDTSATSFPFFLHTSGLNSLFVAFDKDVVVGKGENSDYDHFEAISNAYNLLAKKGISTMHIDYMDNVGKDPRLAQMMHEMNSCPSEDVRNCVLDMYEHLQWYMSDTFSTYDVYCFSSKMRLDLMLDELRPVMDALLNANYIRYRVLGRDEVRQLVSSVMCIPDFSVTRTCDSLFANHGVSNYLKIIWTEVGGTRTKVNKTREELAEEQRIRAAEQQARRTARRNNKGPDVSFNLFDDEQVGDSGSVVNDAEQAGFEVGDTRAVVNDAAQGTANDDEEFDLFE